MQLKRSKWSMRQERNMYESEVHRKYTYTARMNRLDTVTDLLSCHWNWKGNTHWLFCNVKIAGKPVSTCRYTSDAALPIPYDAERLVWARRNILCATEMRPWMILEAFAERIVRLGAHRSSWRNGISEGSHKSFCSQPVVRAAAYPISFKWKLASRREKNLDWCCLSCSDSAIPAVGQNPGLRLLFIV